MVGILKYGRYHIKNNSSTYLILNISFIFLKPTFRENESTLILTPSLTPYTSLSLISLYSWRLGNSPEPPRAVLCPKQTSVLGTHRRFALSLLQNIWNPLLFPHLPDALILLTLIRLPNEWGRIRPFFSRFVHFFFCRNFRCWLLVERFHCLFWDLWVYWLLELSFHLGD